MPRIEKTKDHTLSVELLEERVNMLVEKLASRMEGMNVTYKWRSDKSGVDMEGRGFSGKVEFQPGKVRVQVDLSMMLSPFKTVVAERIEKSLGKYLAPDLPA